MASIKPPQEVNESDPELMKSISLSDPPEIEVADTSEKGHRVEVETNFLGKIKRIFVILRDNLFGIIRVIEDQWLQYCSGAQNERTRAYHVWPGNNVFFFRGRLICGPDPRGLVLTAVSISLSGWIFAVYIADDLPNHSGLIVTCFVILTIIVFVNLIMVSMIDPGIIPRNDHALVEEFGACDRTKKKRVVVNGVEVKLKYCSICNIYRPPRSCHCAVCDNCVEKFDHHCPWIGQCIGLRNYRFYLTFIVAVLVFFVYIFAFSCQRIHQRMSRSGNGLFGMLGNCPETVALASFSFAATGFLGGLICYHVYLIAKNQTANENFRERYMKSRNPYDKGIVSNMKEVLLMPLPPSRVDFRAEVTPWLSECNCNMR